MNLNKQERRYKQYLKTQRELSNLRNRKEDTVELEKPYQNGWVLDIQFTPETLRRSDAPRLLEALSHIKTYKYLTKSEKLIRNIRGLNKSLNKCLHLFRNKYVGYFGPHLESIRIQEFEKKNIPLYLKKYFRSFVTRYGTRVELDLPLHMFEIKITKNIVTHAYIIDPEKESKMAKLRDKLYVLDYEFGHRYYEKDPGYIKDPKLIRRDGKIHKIKKILEQDTGEL